ncbi:MAG: tRNA (N6-isopentenyl adenosine(37)-C2)-methylthiotransferase MiaB [Chloroflexota bacterium]|nr:tRNA (N6-isopentenyl adenosine(37)-C2)-methylthiotransferase MiaB [Chloroflexota bacterium]
MPRYFIWTIGCQMNKAESQRIASYLHSSGYQATPTLENADLIVLNTCVVRQSAEDKVIGTLGLLKGLKKKYPNLSILVTGCFVDSNTAKLKKQFPHVDFFFKPGAYSELVNWLRKQCISTAEQKIILPLSSSPCTFVPIIQGCDNFCSYCIVPYRRGREVSRPMEEIIYEVKQLTQQGTREITLLGQNVDSYGHDLPEKPDLADLLARLNDTEGLSRIRFLTNHPKDISLKLIKRMASLDKVCEHLELPIQAGDNNLLKAMRRGYTVEQYRELVHIIHNNIPQISLSTDVIVGFPGETEDQFEHTFGLLKEIKFDVVHIAAYSPRPGTIAWREHEDNIPSEIKKRRRDKIEELQKNIAGEINAYFKGKTVEILVEDKKKGKWYGRTRNNKLVFSQNDADQSGKLVKIKIDKTSPWALQGRFEYSTIS